MAALVVVESCWGNTAAIAQAIAAGIGGAEVVAAAEAPPSVGAEIDLVVVGAPTHMMGLPSPNSREQAIKQGGTAVSTGVAEWLQAATISPATRIVTFDTRVKSMFAGSAAKAAAKLARRRQLNAEVGKGFIVTGSPAVLTDGALEEAHTWGQSLRR